ASDEWRASRPTPESMIERGRPLVAEQPSDLRERHAWLLQVLKREASPQLIHDLAKCGAFISQPSGERANAEGQSFRDRLRLRLAMRQESFHLVLDRSP